MGQLTEVDPPLDFDGLAHPALGVGPGRRTIMWVRGCERRCPGCMAPELWRPGDTTLTSEVAAMLRPPLRMSDGLTISGGEPLLQAAALSRLIDILRMDMPELEVLVYTGYTIAEARLLGTEASGLLERTDMVVDGPFVEHEESTLQWRGSDNQRVYLLSDRAQRWSDEVSKTWAEPRFLGVQMLSDRLLRIVGIPRRGDLESYRAALARRGVVAVKAVSADMRTVDESRDGR